MAHTCFGYCNVVKTGYIFIVCKSAPKYCTKKKRHVLISCLPAELAKALRKAPPRVHELLL